MAAARYWRLSGFLPSAKATQLELSEITMYNLTSSVMSGVTVTSTVAPDTGSLALLTDGSASAVCSWVSTKILDLVISFDFGAGNTPDIKSVAFGSGANRDNFPLYVTLEYSTDGVSWIVRNRFHRTVSMASMDYRPRRLKWPGANAMQAKTDLANPEDQGSFMFSGTAGWPLAPRGYARMDWQNGTLRYRKGASLGPPMSHAWEPVNVLRTGKLYMEANGALPIVGLVDPTYARDLVNGPGYNYTVGTGKVDFSFAWESSSFYVYSNFTYASNSAYNRPNNSKVVGICIDLDNKQMWAIIDGVEKTKYTIPNLDPAIGCLLCICQASNNTPADFTVNFGREPFVNTPPAGFTTYDWYEIFSYETSTGYSDDSVVEVGMLVGSSPWLPPPSTDLVPASLGLHASHSKDIYKNGRGFIKSTVSIDTTPATYVRRRVFIKEAFTGIAIDDQYSQPGTGVFEFKFLDMNKQYIVYSVDDVTGLATTISGPIYPTKMPIFAVGPYA